MLIFISRIVRILSINKVLLRTLFIDYILYRLIHMVVVTCVRYCYLYQHWMTSDELLLTNAIIYPVANLGVASCFFLFIWGFP